MIKRKIYSLSLGEGGECNPSLASVLQEINELRKDHHIINICEYSMPGNPHSFFMAVYYYFMGEETE